ncbi:MAG TPA: hypothetical protein VM327_04965 [Candidatus Thermoplasmatota archaeon]|nr:hypothetical protein [Candidatus Thermoplasmatota archaeon]
MRPDGLLPCLVLLSALLTAGCTASPQALPGNEPGTTVAWTPLACDPSGPTTRGRNAELVAGLRQTPESIAQDVAERRGPDDR